MSDPSGPADPTGTPGPDLPEVEAGDIATGADCTLVATIARHDAAGDQLVGREGTTGSDAGAAASLDPTQPAHLLDGETPT